MLSIIRKKFRSAPAFLRTRFYANRFKNSVSAHAEKTIKNADEFLQAFFKPNTTGSTTRIYEFYDGYVLKARVGDSNAIGETCILQEYSKLPGFAIKSRQSVFDLGAHIGSFAVQAAKKGAMVYAFEPEDTNFSLLCENIALNGLMNKVIPIKKGIYNFTGRVKLSASQDTAGHSLMHDTGGHVQEIEVTTLAQGLREVNVARVDLLKIDIEGAEYDVFESLDCKTCERINKIVGEYHLISGTRKKDFSLIQQLLAPYFGEVKRLPPYYFYAWR